MSTLLNTLDQHDVSDVLQFQSGTHWHKDYELDQRQVIELTAEATRLICLEGKLWLTSEGDSEDYLLVAGDHIDLGNTHLPVVQAMKSSRLRIVSA
jgi:hypothetical protein